jgi:hypothetical protein
VAVHERLHQEPVVLVGHVEGTLDLPRVPAQRLLAQHMLAALQRADAPLDVQRVGQGDVDDLDVGVLQQLLVAAIRPRDTVLARVFRGARLVSAGHREKFDPFGLSCARHEQPVDARGRDDSPLHG